MMSIGEFSRASGLSVSALRFYDSVGALVPAQVDPQTSYRWYAVSQVADGRLVSRLRRVGMPVAEMKLLVNRRDDAVLVAALLAEHLRHLEEGLDAAKEELARIRADVGVDSATTMVAGEICDAATAFSVRAADLLAALTSVRFALPDSPDPVLSAVLIDIGPTSVTLVASDRYRMAVSELLVADRFGPPAKAAVPQDRLPELERFLTREGTVTAAVCGNTILWKIKDSQLEFALSCEDFPEYHSIVNVEGKRRITTSIEHARSALESSRLTRGHGIDGGTVDVAILAASESGALVARPDTDAEGCVVVNVSFLMEAMEQQAMDAGPMGQLVLDLASPITPLAIRFPDKPGTFSVLMPTRLT